VAASQRTVSSESFNNAISRGPAAAAAGPIRPSALTAWIRTDVELSARADRSVATASTTGSFFGDCANCFGFRKDGQSLPTLATRPRPRPRMECADTARRLPRTPRASTALCRTMSLGSPTSGASKATAFTAWSRPSATAAIARTCA
jgi:hypothetical protein